jgi:hypothetical protein
MRIAQNPRCRSFVAIVVVSFVLLPSFGWAVRRSLRTAAAALQQIRRAEFWGSDPHRSRSPCRILRGDHCDFAAVGLDGGDHSGGRS